MGKHLTLDQRIAIQVGLERNQSINAIARSIGKPARTVAREIKQRRERREESHYGRINNRCIHRNHCSDWKICHTSNCGRYQEEICPHIVSAPFVCNGCAERNRCPLVRYIYNAKKAHCQYQLTLKECRQGANIRAEELQWLDNLVSPGVLKGQSIHHVVLAKRFQLPVCERTIYRYFNIGNMFTALRGDLRRACLLKPRKGKKNEHKLDARCRQGRSYSDYVAYMQEHPCASVVQMDTVIGRIGGKCLLTLHFERFCFQLAILLPDKTAKSVNDAFGGLREKIGSVAFSRLFEVILTDNGTEFSDPLKIEFDGKGKQISHVFYCDPYNTNQKSKCERNHEFIRMVLPKGVSFDNRTQKDVDAMMSHINGYARSGLRDARPVDLFEKRFGERLRIQLGIRKILPTQIMLKPALLNNGENGL